MLINRSCKPDLDNIGQELCGSLCDLAEMFHLINQHSSSNELNIISLRQCFLLHSCSSLQTRLMPVYTVYIIILVKILPKLVLYFLRWLHAVVNNVLCEL